MLDSVQIIYNIRKYQCNESIDAFFKTIEFRTASTAIITLLLEHNTVTSEQLFSYITNASLDTVKEHWKDTYKNSSKMKEIRHTIDILERCKVLKTSRIEVSSQWYEWEFSLTIDAWNSEFESCRDKLIALENEALQTYSSEAFFTCEPCSKKMANTEIKHYFIVPYIEMMENNGRCKSCNELLTVFNSAIPIETIKRDISFIQTTISPLKICATTTLPKVTSKRIFISSPHLLHNPINNHFRMNSSFLKKTPMLQYRGFVKYVC